MTALEFHLAPLASSLSTLAAAPGDWKYWLPPNYSTHGDSIDSLFKWIFWITVIAFVLGFAFRPLGRLHLLVHLPVVRRRRRRDAGDLPKYLDPLSVLFPPDACKPLLLFAGCAHTRLDAGDDSHVAEHLRFHVAGADLRHCGKCTVALLVNKRATGSDDEEIVG